MDKFIEFLNGWGIHVQSDSSHLFLFACSILILAVVTLFSFINIMLYFGVLFLFDNTEFLNKLSQWPILLKLLYYIKKVRTPLFYFEIILFLASLGSIIWLCLSLIFGLMK